MGIRMPRGRESGSPEPVSPAGLFLGFTEANESGGWGRQNLVLVPGVRRCGVYSVEGVSAGAGR